MSSPTVLNNSFAAAYNAAVALVGYDAVVALLGTAVILGLILMLLIVFCSLEMWNNRRSRSNAESLPIIRVEAPSSSSYGSFKDVLWGALKIIDRNLNMLLSYERNVIYFYLNAYFFKYKLVFDIDTDNGSSEIFQL